MSGIDIKKSLVYNTTIDVLVSIDSYIAGAKSKVIIKYGR